MCYNTLMIGTLSVTDVIGARLRGLTRRERPIAATVSEANDAHADALDDEAWESRVPGIPVLSEMTDQEIEAMIEEALTSDKWYTIDEVREHLLSRPWAQ